MVEQRVAAAIGQPLAQARAMPRAIMCNWKLALAHALLSLPLNALKKALCVADSGGKDI